MSIIAYYIHLTTEQLEELRRAPAKLWRMQADATFAGAERYDMDGDWQVIPWLVSEKKREEQKWQTAQMAALMRLGAGPNDKQAFQRAVSEERHRLGVTSDVDSTGKMPDDAALVAIEGRGTKDQRDEAISFGLGGARVFSPAEVQSLAKQLSRIQVSEIRLHFDRKEMARWNVGDIGWLQESDSVLDQNLIPEFRKLQDFYQRAADSGHCVLVVYR